MHATMPHRYALSHATYHEHTLTHTHVTAHTHKTETLCYTQPLLLSWFLWLLRRMLGHWGLSSFTVRNIHVVLLFLGVLLGLHLLLGPLLDGADRGQGHMTDSSCMKRHTHNYEAWKSFMRCNAHTHKPENLPTQFEFLRVDITQPLRRPTPLGQHRRV